MNFLDEKYVIVNAKPRNPSAHKGDFGKVLVFAGNVGMAGAAVLCGKAALRSGAGRVQFLLPKAADPIYPILQVSVPEATCVFHTDNMDFSSYNAICAGPGIGNDAEHLRILRHIITSYAGILILDADALNAVALDPSLEDALAESSAQVILTPHCGEAHRLLKTDSNMDRLEGRMVTVCALTEIFQCITILKGHGTLIARKSSSSGNGFELFENTTGNSGMATAGSGDVLTGVIGALAAQGYDALQSALMGTFIHGKAGDMAANLLGVVGMTASDIINNLPLAFKLYVEEQ